MQIIINNQLAAIKQGSSFDLVAENRYFSGADSCSLAITFPLKDCPQNLAIFGHINRKDVVAGHLLFDCEIRDKAFVLYGSITITEISEVEVKCQFLEGKSVQNYDVTFDEVYINELELGYPDTNRDNTPCDLPYNRDGGMANCNWLALPWVNNNTGNIQNKWKAHHTLWADRVQGLSFQPYMLYLVQIILDAVGFSYNLNAWLGHYKWKYLLCCNTLPYAWGIKNWARALPHWTITELLEQLELLMNCEFDVDLSAKKVTMTFRETQFVSSGRVEIEDVVDEFSETIANASENKYKGLQKVRYSECDHRMWKYMVCPDAIAKMFSFSTDVYTRITFDTTTDMTSTFASYITNPVNLTSVNFNRLFHIEDVDMYFAMRIYKREATPNGHGDYNYNMWVTWQALNQFGSDGADTDSATELKIVPCWLDEVINENKGVKRLMLFLDCPDMEINDGMNDNDENTYDPEENKEKLMTEFNSMPCFYAAHANIDQKQEFFDKIYVGFWQKSCNGRYNYTDGDETDFARWPFPVRDSVEIDLDWTVYQNDEFTLRIGNGSDEVNSNQYLSQIDPTRKYTIKFLSNSIPNPRAIYFIQGKKYICEKLTANFTENGMSQLIKGEFYQIID